LPDRCPECRWEIEGEACIHCGYSYSDSDEDSDESDSTRALQPSATQNQQTEAETNDGDEIMASSDEESDDESEVITGARRHHHEPMLQSRRAENLSVTESDSPGSFYAELLAAGDPGYGLSPIRSISPATSAHLRSNPSMTGSHAARPNFIPPQLPYVILISDDESDENTPTPPRPSAKRGAHLRSHRARRGGRGRGGGFHAPNQTRAKCSDAPGATRR
jgi:hypothetical protein